MSVGAYNYILTVKKILLLIKYTLFFTISNTLNAFFPITLEEK